MARYLPRSAWATIYTDASLDAPAAGVAFWAASQYGRLIESAPVEEPVHDSLLAELHAVRIGVNRTLKEWPEVRALRVTSDSKGALQYLRGDVRSKKRKDVMELVERTLQTERDVYLRFVWVKGHQRGPGTPAYVNRRVDEMARLALRQAKEAAQQG